MLIPFFYQHHPESEDEEAEPPISLPPMLSPEEVQELVQEKEALEAAIQFAPKKAAEDLAALRNLEFQVIRCRILQQLQPGTLAKERLTEAIKNYKKASSYLGILGVVSEKMQKELQEIDNQLCKETRPDLFSSQ